MRATIGYGIKLPKEADYQSIEQFSNTLSERIQIVYSNKYDQPTGACLFIDDSIQVFDCFGPEYLNQFINQPLRRTHWIERMKDFCEKAGVKFSNEFDLDWYCVVQAD